MPAGAKSKTATPKAEAAKTTSVPGVKPKIEKPKAEKPKAANPKTSTGPSGATKKTEKPQKTEAAKTKKSKPEAAKTTTTTAGKPAKVATPAKTTKATAGAVKTEKKTKTTPAAEKKQQTEKPKDSGKDEKAKAAAAAPAKAKAPKAAAPKVVKKKESRGKPKIVTALKINKKGPQLKRGAPLPRTRGKQTYLKYTIDVSKPVEDGIMDAAAFEKYLHDRFKVNGKAGVLGDSVKISREKTRIVVLASIAFSKRYLKYLSKKFLKKQSLRDWLRVVATNKNSYELRYYNIEEQGEGEEGEEEEKA